MNCRMVRERIEESLPAELAAPAPEFLAHCERCADCRAFYERERALFAAIDNGMQGIVNEPVPVSLLPRVRAALERTAVPGPFWMRGWGVALAAGVLALSLGLLMKNTRHHETVTGGESLPAITAASAVGTESSASRGEPQRKKARLARVRTSEPEAKIIVRADERAAFLRYVAGRTREPVQVVAGAERSEDEPGLRAVDIAPLEVSRIEIDALDGTGGQ